MCSARQVHAKGVANCRAIILAAHFLATLILSWGNKTIQHPATFVSFNGQNKCRQQHSVHLFVANQVSNHLQPETFKSRPRLPTFLKWEHQRHKKDSPRFHVSREKTAVLIGFQIYEAGATFAWGQQCCLSICICFGRVWQISRSDTVTRALPTLVVISKPVMNSF